MSSRRRKKLTKEEKIAMLKEDQEQFSEAKEKANIGSGDDMFLYLKDGESADIRFLSKFGRMSRHFQPVGTWNIGNWVNGKFIGTRITASNWTLYLDKDAKEDNPDPIAEARSILYSGNAADEELAKRIKLNKKYYFNVIVRKVDDDGYALLDQYEGPYILSIGPNLFKDVEAKMRNPKVAPYMFDDYEGLDFTLSRTGTGRDTEWSLDVVPGGTTPLIADKKDNPDEEMMDEIYDAANDLGFVVMPESSDEDEEFLKEFEQKPIVRVYPWDRTVEQYGIDPDDLEDIEEILDNLEEGAEDESESDDDTESDEKHETTSKRKSSEKEEKDDEVSERMKTRRRRRK